MVESRQELRGADVLFEPPCADDRHNVGQTGGAVEWQR